MAQMKATELAPAASVTRHSVSPSVIWSDRREPDRARAHRPAHGLNIDVSSAQPGFTLWPVKGKRSRESSRNPVVLHEGSMDLGADLIFESHNTECIAFNTGKGPTISALMRPVWETSFGIVAGSMI